MPKVDSVNTSVMPPKCGVNQCLLMVDSRWSEPFACRGIHLVTSSEKDFTYLQQCYADEAFMQQLLPIGRRKQSNEAILQALKQSEFSVAHYRSMHRVIKKEVCSNSELPSSQSNLKSIGLVSLVDIQIAYRRAELFVGIPDQYERQRATSVVVMLIMDLAFNQIGLHKLTSFVLAN
ncbi:MAG TPA: hypothetical protein PLP93_05500 [Nitrosomonas sp.]|nr:hypothetical protein [Nitrosomonas sp.]